MRVYLAGFMGTTDDIGAAIDAGRPPMLLSYWDVMKARAGVPPILDGWPSKCFLDSGAFSAANSGAAIDMERFAAFYREHADCFDTVANLDVIGDPRASEVNLGKLQALGVPALPVWHFTSSLAELDRMCREHERFALGGVVPYAKKRNLLDAVMGQAWEVIYRHWPRRVHGFGITSNRLLLAHPWYTVDSTSALFRTAFGRSMLDTAKVRRVSVPRRVLLAANARMMNHLVETATNHWTARGVVW